MAKYVLPQVHRIPQVRRNAFRPLAERNANSFRANSFSLAVQVPDHSRRWQSSRDVAALVDVSPSPVPTISTMPASQGRTRGLQPPHLARSRPGIIAWASTGASEQTHVRIRVQAMSLSCSYASLSTRHTCEEGRFFKITGAAARSRALQQEEAARWICAEARLKQP